MDAQHSTDRISNPGSRLGINRHSHSAFWTISAPCPSGTEFRGFDLSQSKRFRNMWRPISPNLEHPITRSSKEKGKKKKQSSATTISPSSSSPPPSSLSFPTSGSVRENLTTHSTRFRLNDMVHSLIALSALLLSSGVSAFPAPFSWFHSGPRPIGHGLKRASPNLPAGWSYTGCYKDSGTSRVLATQVYSGSANTQEACVGMCNAGGYPYAGVEYGQQCEYLSVC